MIDFWTTIDSKLYINNEILHAAQEINPRSQLHRLTDFIMIKMNYTHKQKFKKTNIATWQKANK